MPAPAAAHLRIARPTADMDASLRFWVDGAGMAVTGRQAGHRGTLEEIAFLGWPGSAWHMEIVKDAAARPHPTEEDLLVLYLDGPVPVDLVARLEAAGGTVVPARNPYWDEWGVTIADPDGYRLVLSTRAWG